MNWSSGLAAGIASQSANCGGTYDCDVPCIIGIVVACVIGIVVAIMVLRN